MTEPFIYHRVDTAHAAQAKAMVLGRQREPGKTHPALNSRLLMRPDSRDGRQTWMETYAYPPALPAGDELPGLRALPTRGPAELQRWIEGDRPLEVFEPCA